MMEEKTLRRHFALVTGASSGIGYAFARELGKRGYNLLIVSNEEAIHDKASELKQIYPNIEVESLVLDLSRQDSARQLYTYTQEQGMEIEVLVNNAGVYHDRDILDDSEGFTSLILNLHVYTPAMLCWLYGQEMRERKKGYMLNVCSVTSKIAVQRLGTYSSTKAFLNNFTRSLHIELKPFGVHVTNVSPGAVDTGLYSIRPWMTQAGKCLGMVVSPETLARRGLNAMFRGTYKVTVPAVFWHILTALIQFIPTGLLRCVRRWGWF